MVSLGEAQRERRSPLLAARCRHGGVVAADEERDVIAMGAEACGASVDVLLAALLDRLAELLLEIV